MATDDAAIRLYLSERLGEVRRIEREAVLVEAELVAVLGGGSPRVLDPVRLDAWIDRRRTELAHVDVELHVLAGAGLGTPWWARWVAWVLVRVRR